LMGSCCSAAAMKEVGILGSLVERVMGFG
jgi:hypothetical protein